jgi:hypothetical protein
MQRRKVLIKNFQRLPSAYRPQYAPQNPEGPERGTFSYTKPTGMCLVAGLPSSRPTTYWARTLILTPSRPTLAITFLQPHP